MTIKLKRIYVPPDDNDGYRILVDRLWPRGISKTGAKIDSWLQEIAPSEQLRKWFAHDAAKWPEFKRRYFLELSAREALIGPLLDKASAGNLTLVYAAHDAEHNNAAALQEYLERRVIQPFRD
jgi:uncharacterized protein YeaO (DUF488 family)